MKLGTQTDVVAKKLGDIEAVKLLAKAGYDCLDYSMFCMNSTPDTVLLTDGWKEHIDTVLVTAKECGVTFHQAHAPFSFKDRSARAYREENLQMVIRSIEIAGALGVDTIIVHPIQVHPYLECKQTAWDLSVEYYKALLPHAKKAGVRIALENMWEWDSVNKRIIDDICADPVELAAMYDALNDPSFTVCLDLGHVGLCDRDAADAIRILGDRLGALHVHDNDNKADLHTLPYMGKMNWDTICKALADIDYKGVFTYEADNFIAKIDAELLPAACKFMVDTGRYLISKIESAK